MVPGFRMKTGKYFALWSWSRFNGNLDLVVFLVAAYSAMCVFYGRTRPTVGQYVACSYWMYLSLSLEPWAKCVNLYAQNGWFFLDDSTAFTWLKKRAEEGNGEQNGCHRDKQTLFSLASKDLLAPWRTKVIHDSSLSGLIAHAMLRPYAKRNCHQKCNAYCVRQSSGRDSSSRCCQAALDEE